MDDDSAKTLSHSFSLELFNSLAQHGAQINMLCLFNKTFQQDWGDTSKAS